MPDFVPGSAAQSRNKIWLRQGIIGHFARLTGYTLLIPIHLAILIFSVVLFALSWLFHLVSIRSWLRKPLGEPITLLLLSLIVLSAMTLYGPFASVRPSGREKTVVLERGLSVREIAAKLNSAQIVPNINQFLFLTKLLGAEGRLQAGKYLFVTGSPPIDVIQRLFRGGVVSSMVTIPEGMTLVQIAHLLERESGIDAQSFVALATSRPEALRRGIDAVQLEGYLFPDTYGLYWNMPAEDVIDILISRFEQVYDEGFALRARELGMSRHQVITLASMIEEEARMDEERSIISAVYHNRLKEQMLLQCDPTVIYALGGRDAPLTREDLEVDSDYNTYRNYGLPPGPICNPGRASILAALHPADVDFLYFVARGDGSHHFSQTNQEHINAIHTIRRNLGG